MMMTDVSLLQEDIEVSVESGDSPVGRAGPSFRIHRASEATAGSESVPY